MQAMMSTKAARSIYNKTTYQSCIYYVFVPDPITVSEI